MALGDPEWFGVAFVDLVLFLDGPGWSCVPADYSDGFVWPVALDSPGLSCPG